MNHALPTRCAVLWGCGVHYTNTNHSAVQEVVNRHFQAIQDADQEALMTLWAYERGKAYTRDAPVQSLPVGVSGGY